MIRRALLIVLLLLSAAALAQTPGKKNLGSNLLSIRVTGLTHLKESEVVRATGLRLGTTAKEQDFRQAVKKLGDTGLFTDVAYSYRYTAAGCELELKLEENDKLVPIVFDNFVWFSDEDLISLLRARVPLFEGKLPLGGDLSDQVGDALNVILQEHKIAGQAEGIQTAKLNGPIDSYTYTVQFHPVIIRKVDFPGAAQEEVPGLQEAGKSLHGIAYLRSDVRPHEALDLLPVYLSRGYLKAHFSDSQARIVEDGPRTVVDISCPVTPGIQYRVKQVQWTGVSAFPVDKLQAMLHLPLGEPANAIQLQSDLDAVHKLYGTKGYLMAYATPQPAMDDSAATVAYELAVTEGDVFHMGDLQIDGIDTSAASKLEAQWQMKKGDVFDDSYLPRFFQVLYHDFGLSRSFSVVPKQTVNQPEKTVNIALHFVPRK